MADDQRKWPRIRFDGEAIWKAANVEHRARLLDLSLGGAALDDRENRLQVGDRLRMTFVLEESLALHGLEVEVVHKAEEHVGVRFSNPSAALLRQLQQLTANHPPGNASR